MANTRQASFRLGGETERKLDELAELSDSSRTEVLRELIAERYTRAKSPAKHESGKEPPVQMILDDILSVEVVGYD